MTKADTKTVFRLAGMEKESPIDPLNTTRLLCAKFRGADISKAQNLNNVYTYTLVFINIVNGL